jgi:hypothetical protein
MFALQRACGLVLAALGLLGVSACGKIEQSADNAQNGGAGGQSEVRPDGGAGTEGGAGGQSEEETGGDAGTDGGPGGQSEVGLDVGAGTAGSANAAGSVTTAGGAGAGGAGNTPSAGSAGTLHQAGSAGASGASTGGNAGAGNLPFCDPVSGECWCVRVAMLGRLPAFAALPGQDDTAQLQAWLNEHSSAVVSVHTTDVELTPAFLAQYDVLILQVLEEQEGGPYWDHTAAEIANLEAWVRAGGGIITMSGYTSQSAEVDPTNQLLAFAGLSYNTDDILYDCPDDWNDCCYCVGNSVPVGGWNSAHPLSAHITAVGAFHGRSVNVPVGGQLVASEGDLVYGATVQLDAGRVFMFADDWVSYASQWTGEGLSEDCTTYGTAHSCYGISPATSYQVPQFWFNAIAWASGVVECFSIDDPTIVH